MSFHKITGINKKSSLKINGTTQYYKKQNELKDNSLSDDKIINLSDDFIIFWVFFSIVTIFIIIPLVYILSAIILVK